jgi:hypothetical protein
MMMRTQKRMTLLMAGLLEMEMFGELPCLRGSISTTRLSVRTETVVGSTNVTLFCH